MLKVGLTGGIASGKSTVAKMFEDEGAYLIDFDELAHFVEEPDQPAWKAIVEFFGREILNEDGSINRAKLGQIVFSDQEKLSRLNSIVHPAVFDLWRRRIEDIRQMNPRAIVVSDVPLLIEVSMQHLFDVVILVYVSPEDQISRLRERNEYSRKEAESRLDKQMPIDEKIPYADYVIDNKGPIETTRSIVSAVWDELLMRERKNLI
ncbi:MAG: dephospho-CoA kinase [Syntrophales bacterium]|jgi:dephospho-CoA kinase